MLPLLSKSKLGTITLIAIITKNALDVSAESPPPWNWNITGSASRLSNETANRLTIGIQNASGIANASSKSQDEMNSHSSSRRGCGARDPQACFCVPLASELAYLTSSRSWLSSLQANELLPKKIITTTSLVTSYGYRGCLLGFGTMETSVVTITITPNYTQSEPACATSADGCGRCAIFAESVQLLYWPVSTYLGNHNKSISPTESVNFTTTSNGITFISPSVYLSYQNVWTTRRFCHNTGKNYSGALLTLKPDHVMTRAKLEYKEVTASYVSGATNWSYWEVSQVYMQEHTLNYADLNTLLLVNSTRAQQTIDTNSLPDGVPGYCNQTAILPILILPSEIRNLDPDWKNCSLNFWGSQDPPRPLKPVDVLAGPISTFHPAAPSWPAVPIALPLPQVATSTAGQNSAVIVKPTFTDGVSASPSSPSDPQSQAFTLDDPPVKNPASPQPASKIVPTLDHQVFTTNADESISPSSKATSHDGFAMKSSDPVISTNANGIVVEGTTVAHEKAPMFESTIQTAAPITFESMTFSAQRSDYVVLGQTLRPGSGITVSGTPILLDPLATALIVGPHTTDLAAATALPILPIGSQTLTADPLSRYDVNGQQLTPGGAITLSGTPISLAPSAKALIINSITTPLGPALVQAPALPPLTLDSHTFTADSSSAYHIMGHILTPGGAIAVSGTLVSLAPSAIDLVVESSTEILPQPSFTAPGLGELINSAFGHIGGSDASSINNSTIGGNASYSGIVFTGDGGRECSADWRWAFVPMMGGLCYVL